MTDKINEFLQETELRNLTKRYGGRGIRAIGTKLGRRGAKAILGLMDVESATDHIVLSANREVVLPIVAETLQKIGVVKDSALFDAPTVTFAALLVPSILGVKGKPCLVFLTLKPLSEHSTHVLIEGYTKTWGQRHASNEVKRVRKEISARFS
jgi:hypothetical protein